MIEKLKVIAAKRTKGEWKWDSNRENDMARESLKTNYESELRTDTLGIIQSWDYEGYSSGLYIRKEDMDFIAMASNCFDEMLAVVEKLEWFLLSVNRDNERTPEMEDALKALHTTIKTELGK